MKDYKTAGGNPINKQTNFKPIWISLNFYFKKNENNHTSANPVSVLYSSKGGGPDQPNNGSHTLICSAAFNWGKGSNLFLHVFKVSIIVAHISSGKIIKCESKKKRKEQRCLLTRLSLLSHGLRQPSITRLSAVFLQQLFRLFCMKASIMSSTKPWKLQQTVRWFCCSD